MISPSKITPVVEKLLQVMEADFEPELVPVIVESYAKPLSCYMNVAEKIRRDGGKIHYGWTIWKGKYICEAEHHAVWEDDDGNLLCITPREVNVKTIMFVPDNEKVYTGKSYDNIRVNITNNPLVDDFIKLFEINEQLCALGDRVGDFQVDVPEIALAEIYKNDIFKHNIELFLDIGGKLDSPCYCNSGEVYNKCHGKDLIKTAIENLHTIRQYLSSIK